MNPTLRACIKQLVRVELGCSCPERVFDSIGVDHAPGRFEGLPVDCLIEIGGRLLVVLVWTVPWRVVSGDLPRLVVRSRELRDKGRFNRLRIVIASAECEAAEKVLMQQFAALPSLDDRLHLHIVAPEVVADLDPLMGTLDR